MLSRRPLRIPTLQKRWSLRGWQYHCCWLLLRLPPWLHRLPLHRRRGRMLQWVWWLGTLPSRKMLQHPWLLHVCVWAGVYGQGLWCEVCALRAVSLSSWWAVHAFGSAEIRVRLSYWWVFYLAFSCCLVRVILGSRIAYIHYSPAVMAWLNHKHLNL